MKKKGDLVKEPCCSYEALQLSN